MSVVNLKVSRQRAVDVLHDLNYRYHAPALWIFMLIIVAHWMEHVLQIYQIYVLGWSPDKAGGILGVIYPSLIESETLHFVYDFIQWAGIIVLRPGFRARVRAFTYWTAAMVVQTWHFIEHCLLMGQYLTGYYLFGAPYQISIGQIWFPRAELHFAYNLFTFVPMAIAVHFYLKPRLAVLEPAKIEPTRLPASNKFRVNSLPRRASFDDYNGDETRAEIPFGENGAQFLRNVLQYSVFLGIVLLTVMIVQWIGAR